MNFYYRESRKPLNLYSINYFNEIDYEEIGTLVKKFIKDAV